MSGPSSNNNNNPATASTTTPSPWQPWPDSALTMARTALSLTSQDWSLTGRGPGHPSIHPFLAAAATTTTASPSNNTNTTMAMTNSIVDEVSERMVSLLLIRIVALVTCRLGNVAVVNKSTEDNTTKGGGRSDGNSHNATNGHRIYRRASNDSSKTGGSSSGGGGGGGAGDRGYYRRLKDKMYMDYSTSTICRSALKTAREEEGKRMKEQQQLAAATTTNEDDGKIMSMKKIRSKEEGDAKQQHQDATPMTTLRQTSSEPKSYYSVNNTPNKSTTKSTTTTTTTTGLFPKCITPQIIHQLRTYVHTICSQYHSPIRVPYHNVEHAYHVFLSANKLLDLMLCEHTDDRDDKLLLLSKQEEEEEKKKKKEAPPQSSGGPSKQAVSSTPKHTNNNNNNNPRPKFRRATLDSLLDHRPTYGIKSDPLTQLAFLFSALVHDVDHTGISNRQLVLESDDLAILYNDQSVAEQRSLAIAFSVLKRGEFDELRRVLFEVANNSGGGEGGASGGGGGGTPAAAAAGGGGGDNNEDWFKFRKLVIDLVLVTDIASPERTQIVKSKWKEAFGEVIVAEKMKEKSSRFLNSGGGGGGKRFSSSSGDGGGTGAVVAAVGKESLGRQQQVGGSNRGEGNLNPNAININIAPVVDDPSKAVTRKMRRATLESCGRYGSQRSILTADISLNSNSILTDEVEVDNYADNDVDNDDNDSTDARSIDISESSSISDIQSLDDDFDASAVSRTKMSVDPNGFGDGSFNSGNSKSNAQQKSQQQQQPSPSSSKVVSTGPRDQVARFGNRVRKSTGDLVGTSIPEEIKDPVPKPRGRSTESRPLNRRRTTLTFRGRLCQSMVTPGTGPQRARSEERRLGVRRALDLAGSTIVAYNNTRSSLRSSGGSSDYPNDIDFDEDDDWDEIDEFKATVVLEQMIRAADVAALLQDWNNVMKWSTRLYKELKNGFLSNRGEDPAVGWYDNQIKFFDFYIKPLAKNLGIMGVFDEKVGHSFVQLVKSNLARWIEDGELATSVMIRQDESERQRGHKKGSSFALIDESDTSKSSLDKSIESLGLGNSVGEVKVSALSTSSTSLISDTPSGVPGNSGLNDSFNSASTASTTNRARQD